MPRAPGRPARSSSVPTVVVVVLAAILGACSSGSVSGVADGPPTDLGDIADQRGHDTVAVTIADNIYTPRAIQVSPGTKVTFANEGANVHNVTPDQDGSFGAVSVGPGESAEVTVPTAPGTYRFFCTLHASRDSGLQRGAFVVG